MRDIEYGSIRLNGLIAPGKVKLRGRGKKRYLLVKFPRKLLLHAIDPSSWQEIEVEVSGKVDGVTFLGTDTIYLKGRGRRRKRRKEKRKKHTSSPEVVQAGDAIYFYHLDHLGTPAVMTDEEGHGVWNAIYMPFGVAAVSPESGLVNNLRFPGQYYDQERGLHYNYHRYYNPSTGRYLTPDVFNLRNVQLGNQQFHAYSSRIIFCGYPLTSQSTWISYLYALNNPIYFTDPLGLYSLRQGLQDTARYAGVGATVSFLTPGGQVAALAFTGVGIAAIGVEIALYSDNTYLDTIKAIIKEILPVKKPYDIFTDQAVDSIADAIKKRGKKHDRQTDDILDTEESSEPCE